MSAESPHIISDPSQNAGPTILAVTLSMTFVAFAVLCLRLYVRRVMIRNLGIDDLLMTCAISLAIGHAGIVIAQVRFGMGRHLGDVNPKSFTEAMKFFFVGLILYMWTMCTIKASVGFSLLRIATERVYRWIIIGTLCFMIGYTSASFVALMTSCSNIRAQWDLTVAAHAKCWDGGTFRRMAWAASGINIVTDLLFALFIPIPMLWKLQMNIGTKVSVMVILGLGLFACVASIVRIPYLVNFARKGDPLWDTRYVIIWSVVEMALGIIAGSLITLRPLVRGILSTFSGSGSSSGKLGDREAIRDQQKGIAVANTSITTLEYHGH